MIRSIRAALAAAVMFALALVAAAPAYAAAGVRADVVVGVNGRLTGANDLGTPSFPFALTKTNQFTAGAGSTGLADQVFFDTRTIAASGTDSLDLTGTLTTPLGATLACAKVKTIGVFASPANTNNVVVGGGSNPFIGPWADTTDKLAIPPGGMLLLTHPTTGWTVTASTGDLFLVANSGSGTGVTYDVVVICATS